MSLAVISPHLDDAVFSLAEHLSVRPDATVVCPFAATPTDDAGKLKYDRLHHEHDLACKLLKLNKINGPFLDDVYYETRGIEGLFPWLVEVLRTFDEIWMPFGIHHPDHTIVAHAAMLAINAQQQSFSFYEELPYRVLYPEKVDRRIYKRATIQGSPQALDLKRRACRLYASQMVGGDIERCLYVPERLWKVR